MKINDPITTPLPVDHVLADFTSYDRAVLGLAPWRRHALGRCFKNDLNQQKTKRQKTTKK